MMNSFLGTDICFVWHIMVTINEILPLPPPYKYFIINYYL